MIVPTPSVAMTEFTDHEGDRADVEVAAVVGADDGRAVGGQVLGAGHVDAGERVRPGRTNGISSCWGSMPASRGTPGGASR